MVDPDVLLVKSLIEALDDSGVSPESDEDEARALIDALKDRGYVITKKVETTEAEE